MNKQNMDNEEPSPVKLINWPYLEIKSWNFLICGKRAGNKNRRSPWEKNISTYITS